MEIKHIKELMAAMGRTATKKLMLKKDGFELHLEREENGHYKMSGDHGLEGDENLVKAEIEGNKGGFSLARGGEMSASRPSSPSLPTEIKEDITSIYITSPMVGTYYSSPSPDDPAFIKVGDRIEKNTVVCIIEAMKVMNEVKAGVSGTVAEVLMETGHPVEFGTKLFRII